MDRAVLPGALGKRRPHLGSSCARVCRPVRANGSRLQRHPARRVRWRCPLDLLASPRGSRDAVCRRSARRRGIRRGPRADGSALEAADRRASVGKAPDAFPRAGLDRGPRGPPAAARAAGRPRGGGGDRRARTPRRRIPGAAARPARAPVRPHRRDRALGGAGPRAARSGAYPGSRGNQVAEPGGAPDRPCRRGRMGNSRARSLAPLSGVAGRVAYAGAFTVVLPALLAAWARSADRFIHLPALYAPVPGVAITVGGMALFGWACVALFRDGGGLPMNAFPPPRWVATGPYRFLAHPIYFGFIAAVFGCAVATGSPSGLWIVGPATALGCLALVFGYEAGDVRRRFGSDLPRPLLSLPSDSADPVRANDRASALALVAVPWLVLYGAAMLLGPAPDAIATWLPFERRLPVVEEAELLYCSTYPIAAAALFLARTRAEARRLLVRALLAMAVVYPFYFLLPFVAPPRPFVARGWLGWLLLQEREHDTIAAALPSFHVVWALLAADAWANRFPKAARAAYSWAGLVALSCILTGMHSIADVAAGALVVLAVSRAALIWEALRRVAERIANRWTEWRIGRARILG